MSTMVSNLELIRRVPLFSMLTAGQAESVAEAVVKNRFKRGDAIVEQGKKSNALSIILTGRARVITTDQRGREVILATMQPGDYVGEMSLIDNEPHSATVRAEVESLALMDVYGRVARALLEFAIPDAQGNAVIRDKVSRQDLAKMVGASREMVSRVMKDLEERGFIETRSDGSMLVKERLNALG
jgi:CRP/FNR family cyclic AMP-dependent transcriptional regulator